MIGNLESYVVPIRQSTCLTCHSCLRKCLFKLRLGLQPNKPTFAKSSNLGTLVHRYQKLGLGPESDATIREELMKEMQPHLDAVRSNQDLFGDSQKALKDADDNLQKAKAVAEIFAELYPPNSNLKSIVKEEEVEATVQVPDLFTGGRPIPLWLSGTIDDLQQLSTDDSFWIRDFKNTGREADDIWVGYAWSPQLRLYRILANAWLAQQWENDKKEDPVTGGRPGVTGFILNILASPGIILSGADRNFQIIKKVLKSGPRKGLEIEEKEYYGEPVFANYVQRVKEWYREQAQRGEKQAAISVMIPFTEPVMPYEFLTFLLGIRWATTVSLRKATAESLGQQFGKDPTGKACREFSRTCEYYPLCNAEPSKWQAIIETSYKQVEPKVCLKESEHESNTEHTDNADSGPRILTLDGGQSGHEGPAGNDSGRISVVGS